MRFKIFFCPILVILLQVSFQLHSHEATHEQPRLERLDHIAVWVADWQKTANFLTNVVGWKLHPVRFAAAGETIGGMDLVFVDGQGLWLELVEPTTPGPGMDMLETLGDGAIIELDFWANNYQLSLDEMESRGIQMLNMDGSPLKDRGRIIDGVMKGGDIDSSEYIAYFPPDLTGGTAVEILERFLDDEDSIINKRDKMWGVESLNQPIDPNVPRIDHLSILVEDLEKIANFYSDVLGLKRGIEFETDGNLNEVGGFKAVFLNANGIYEKDLWLQLLQPVGPGPVMDLLNKHGNGYVLEIGAEVDDLDKFYDQMKEKGITMVNLDGSPLASGEKGTTIKPYGERHYFPLERSFGMRIMIYERGSSSTSILHQRDSAF